MYRKFLRILSLCLALVFLAACGALEPAPPDETTTTTAPSGARKPVTVVIPEGFHFVQIAQRLEYHGVVDAYEFFRAAQAFEVQSFETPFSPESAFFLEGFLFPDTYEFYPDEDPNTVLRRMLNNYAARVLPLMAENNTGMSDYEILILASIIEREARSTEHMLMVSSVFHNRMDINMRMQANPTRYYARDVLANSPWIPGDADHWLPLYDTYLRQLSIGPICNPGLRAIYAALNPAESDYLFFFFGMDNNNHYTRTYAEHREAMARIGVNFG